MVSNMLTRFDIEGQSLAKSRSGWSWCWRPVAVALSWHHGFIFGVCPRLRNKVPREDQYVPQQLEASKNGRSFIEKNEAISVRPSWLQSIMHFVYKQRGTNIMSTKLQLHSGRGVQSATGNRFQPQGMANWTQNASSTWFPSVACLEVQLRDMAASSAHFVGCQWLLPGDQHNSIGTKVDSHIVATTFASSGSLWNANKNLSVSALESRRNNWWVATGYPSLSSGRCIWSTSWALRTLVHFVPRCERNLAWTPPFQICHRMLSMLFCFQDLTVAGRITGSAELRRRAVP